MQIKLNRPILIVLFFSFMMFFTSCEDYLYESKEPDFLGESIYDHLKSEGNFKYFVRLIDDLDYTEVLSRTGSKTLFPANDEAFERFFRGNSYGVRSYEELSYAQKRSILNTSMLNMAYLSYMLSNIKSENGLGEGLALRHNTSNTYLDSVNFLKSGDVFDNPYWSRFQTKGIYVLEDGFTVSMVHFTPQNIAEKGITNEDFSKLYNGTSYATGDIFINGIKVIERDITCKNGYIHVLEDVMTPPRSMAQIIDEEQDANLFSKLMNKFSAPYFDESRTKSVHEYYNGSAPDRPLISDSIFVKRFFNESNQSDPNNKTVSNYGLLYFDPGNTQYSSDMQDMGAMFLPTNQAMTNYWNSESGRFLREAFSSWEEIPTRVLSLFIKNHQKRSFQAALPHSWPTMADEASFVMNVKPNDIIRTHVGSNGAVFVSNTAYPPIDYGCVYASVLINKNTQIMNWALQEKIMKYYLYLRSMENMYNLIVPTDEAFQNYREPVSWAKGGSNREIWSFKYNANRDAVYADVYSADSEGNKGNFKREITDSVLIRNRFIDIIDMSIVVGEKVGDNMSGYIDDGKTQYAMTKEGSMLKVSGAGGDLKILGGGEIELGQEPSTLIDNPATGGKLTYDTPNGRTYFTNKLVHDPSSSVYETLGKHSEYTEFFNLLKGDDRVYSYFRDDEDISPIFVAKISGLIEGVGYVVKSFANFRYTVFVPTKEALDEAFASDDKLFTWDEIANDMDYDSKKEKTLYLLNFLKYHFMDNSVFISGNSFSDMVYETAARDISSKFYKLYLSSSGNNLEVECEKQSNGATVKAKVLKTEGLYNVMARDIQITDLRAATPTISSSSKSVIHLIDSALRFE